MRRTIVFLALVLGACNGEAATDSPPRLDGSYTSAISPSAFRGSDLHESLAGEWRLDIRGTTYELFGPRFFRIREDLEVTSDETVVVSALPAPGGAYNCYDKEGRRLTPPAEVEAIYSYTFEGTKLNLVADDEPCPSREVLMERVWDKKQ